MPTRAIHRPFSSLSPLDVEHLELLRLPGSVFSLGTGAPRPLSPGVWHMEPASAEKGLLTDVAA